MSSTGAAMLDFDDLQEFPKMSSWGTKLDFICDLMGIQNPQKTLYFLRFPGCHPGNWTRRPPLRWADQVTRAPWATPCCIRFCGGLMILAILNLSGIMTVRREWWNMFANCASILWKPLDFSFNLLFIIAGLCISWLAEVGVLWNVYIFTFETRKILNLLVSPNWHFGMHQQGMALPGQRSRHTSTILSIFRV